MSVNFTYRQDVDFSLCMEMANFPRPGHIYSYVFKVKVCDTQVVISYAAKLNALKLWLVCTMF